MDQIDPLQTEEFAGRSGSLNKLAGRLRDYLLFFLDAIGLWEDKRVDRSTQLSKLRLYHTEFRKLLSANNSFLETLGDLEKKSLGQEFLDKDFIKRRVVRAIADIHAMVESLNAISADRYPVLRERLENIASTLTCSVDETCVLTDSKLVMNLREVSRLHADLVGGKMANLGELITKLGLPAPGGMVVTTEGYRLLMESGGLRSWIQDKHMELPSVEDIALLSATLQEQILALSLPAALKNAILEGFDRICSSGSGTCMVAVRSSAVGEDSEFSFAGQFLSLLNVSRENLCDAYLRVLASLYCPEAIHYRGLHGIPGESAEMAVGFMTMVDAGASGVVFTSDPNDPCSGKILIQAVRGLGLPLVDGRVSPEAVYVPRSGDDSGIARIASEQSFRSSPAPADGVLEESLSAEEAAEPCISDEEASQLARWALVLEGHFGGPQDIEWAIDKQRRLIILQSRPLRLPREHAHMGTPLPGAVLLLRGGETACPGAGAGVAVHMAPDDDLDAFPHGAVLVARRSSPRYVRVMSKASAIITDVGSTTGHMASLAREFQVPALLNTAVATRDIENGKMITVDAGNGFVYEGEIPELIAREAPAGQFVESEPVRRSSPEMNLLEQVLELISPLGLTDPASPDFTPAKCSTLHDIARFVHEKSYREMFMLGENVGDLRGASFKLDVFIPVDLYVVDLGGGLKANLRGNKVKPSQIASAPFAALIKGMLNKKIQRSGPKPMDMRGLFSIMMRHAVTSPEQEHSFSEPCYAIVSDSYVNYTARVGYHFSVVDTYCSGIPNKNYISILFRGGAADFVRRNRRTRAIGAILKEYGFSVEVVHDMAIARLGKATREETITQLEMIGSLFQFFRQMDAAMIDEESISLYTNAFLSGDYGLERLS